MAADESNLTVAHAPAAADTLTGMVEGTTPLIIGQAARMLPFALELADGRRQRGELLSLRSMEDSVSLLLCRDGQVLERVAVPIAAFKQIDVQRRPLEATVSPSAPDSARGDAPIIANTHDLGLYLERWGTDPERARSLLPKVIADTLSAALPDAAQAQELIDSARRFGIPLIAPALLDPDAGALGVLAPAVARRLGALPLVERAGVLAIAVADPARDGMLNQLEFATGRRIAPVLALAAQIEKAIAQHYDFVEDRQMLQALGLSAGIEASSDSLHDVERLSTERPVVRLVYDLINAAVRKKASDIHVRPGAHHVDILYRIDGVLQLARSMDRALLAAVVSRIKVLGTMNIAERRLPQDGRASFAANGRVIDLRISVLPTVDGESVVIRLLDTAQSIRKLADLGLGSVDSQRFADLLARSHGMVLVTGPTGSGKSTTLYAAINQIRSSAINVVTVENPVEYHIDGIMQVQINEAIGYTFAKTLRNILRHDPDVVMVGEIRDAETARIATEAALTGHLLLSTLHTNSAATTVTRLLELGVESFLLKSTLLGVLAQRLARRNCPHCLQADTPDAHMVEVMGAKADESFFRSRGCTHCEGSGVAGRVAVYELMPVDAGLRRLIEPHADADAMHSYAVAHGMTTISQHALALARQGAITLAEAFRIHVD